MVPLYEKNNQRDIEKALPNSAVETPTDTIEIITENPVYRNSMCIVELPKRKSIFSYFFDK